jgi:predicted secreted acid phosphatase
MFCEKVRGYEVILSVGDNLGDYAEYYGRVTDSSGTTLPRQHPTPGTRRESALQDLRLFGRDFVLLPNATYGGWLRAFEANFLGASDELALTGDQVREELKEPLEEFCFGDTQSIISKGPKFSESNFRCWKGPSTA